MNYGCDLSTIGLDAAFTMLPILSRGAEAQVDQSLFLAAFKYDLSDSYSLLGKFSRSFSKKSEMGSFVGACSLQSQTGGLADLYMLENSFAIGSDLVYGLDWHYQYGYLSLDKAF